MHLCACAESTWPIEQKCTICARGVSERFEGILKPVFFFGDSNGSVRLRVAQVQTGDFVPTTTTTDIYKPIALLLNPLVHARGVVITFV